MKKKTVFASELALVVAVVVNSFALVLGVKGGFGVSTLSSVPLVFSKIFDSISLGAWTILVQVVTLFLMMLVTRKFKLGYCVSFLVSIAFGFCVDFASFIMIDFPLSLLFRVLYFSLCLLITGFGAALFVLCELPIQPFDLVVREFRDFTGKSVKTVRTIYDILSVSTSIILSYLFLGRLVGVGVGTIIAMIFTGTLSHKYIGLLSERYIFKPVTKVGEVLKSIS